jgi:hypothetical protein
MIKNDIKTKYLKAHIVSEIIRMTALLEPAKIGIASNDGLDKHVIDSLLDLLTVVSELVKCFVDGGERTFVTLVAFSGLLIEYEIGVELVNSVVS